MNIECRLDPENNRIGLFKNTKLIGFVHAQDQDEIKITFFSNQDGVLVLTMTDIDIVKDNWNQLQELRNELNIKIEIEELKNWNKTI